MSEKPSVSDEVMEWFYSNFKKSYGSDLRPISNTKHGEGSVIVKKDVKLEAGVDYVPDSYEEKDRLMEGGEEFTSSYHEQDHKDKFMCPDLNLPYTPTKSEEYIGSSKRALKHTYSRRRNGNNK